jgi:hypothetical protein
LIPRRGAEVAAECRAVNVWKRRIEMEFVMAKKKHMSPEKEVSPAKEVPRKIGLHWEERTKTLYACFADEHVEALRPRKIVNDLGMVGSLDEAFAAIARRFPAQGTPSKESIESLGTEGPDIPYPVKMFWALK